MTSYIRAKVRLRQISDIYCELIKIRDGATNYTCEIRNMLQVFSGEMQLHCSLDINEEISDLAILLEEGVSDSNWNETNDIILHLYELVLKKCSIIYK
jgi:hypothetical protein